MTRAGRVRRFGEPVSPPLEKTAASPSRVIVAEMRDARHAAETIVAGAREEAHQILEGARRDAEILAAEARASGRAEGIASTCALAREFEARRAAMWTTEKDRMVRFALDVARCVIGREVAMDPISLGDIVSTALRGVMNQSDIVVRVSPTDFGTREIWEVRLVEKLGSLAGVTITPDDRVRPGGCVIETCLGSIDAQVESQLDSIREDLLACSHEEGLNA